MGNFFLFNLGNCLLTITLRQTVKTDSLMILCVILSLFFTSTCTWREVNKTTFSSSLWRSSHKCWRSFLPFVFSVPSQLQIPAVSCLHLLCSWNKFLYKFNKTLLTLRTKFVLRKQGHGVRFLKVYVRKERLDLERYCKLEGSGACSPRKFFKFRGSEMLFPAFSQDVFSK